MRRFRDYQCADATETWLSRQGKGKRTGFVDEDVHLTGVLYA